MTVQDFVAFLQHHASSASFQTDSDGLLVGSYRAKIQGIAVTWCATRELLQAAVHRDLNLVVSYEPVFYHPEDRFKEFEKDEAFIRKMQEILNNRLLVYRWYRPWIDFPCRGVLAALAAALSLPDNQARLPGILLCEMEESLKGLCERIQNALGPVPLKLLGEGSRRVAKLGIVCGYDAEIAQLRDCLQERADTVLTGYLRNTALRYAEDSGLNVIQIDRSKLERPGIRGLTEFFQSGMPEMKVELLHSDQARYYFSTTKGADYD